MMKIIPATLTFGWLVLFMGVNSVDISGIETLRETTVVTTPHPKTQFIMDLRITNRIYHDSLSDQESEEYQSLKQEVEQLFFYVYGLTSLEYLGTDQMTFRNGSVIVSTQLLFGTTMIDPVLGRSLFFSTYKHFPSSTLEFAMDYTSSVNSVDMFAVDSITENAVPSLFAQRIDTKFYMEIRITNRIYNTTLEDTGSAEYETLQQEVDQLFFDSYNKTPLVYITTEHIFFRNGSVIAGAVLLFRGPWNKVIVKSMFIEGYNKLLANSEQNLDIDTNFVQNEIPTPLPLTQNTTTPTSITHHTSTSDITSHTTFPSSTSTSTHSPTETATHTLHSSTTLNPTSTPHNTTMHTNTITPHHNGNITTSPHNGTNITSSPNNGTNITSSPLDITIITSSPHNSTIITSSPHNRPNITSSPLNGTNITSSPLNITITTSSPLNFTNITSSPHNGTNITSSPLNNTITTSSPLDGTNITSSPHNSTNITSSPHISTNITSSPHNSANITSSPHNSTNITSSPHNGTNITSSPHNSTNITSSPHNNTNTTTPHNGSNTTTPHNGSNITTSHHSTNTPTPSNAKASSSIPNITSSISTISSRPTDSPTKAGALVPDWGIALLVLAAISLLLLIILLIILLVMCCCWPNKRTVVKAPEVIIPPMYFNPDIPMYSTHSTIDTPNGKQVDDREKPPKNRTGMYVVNK